jgi:hypothetical protein
MVFEQIRIDDVSAAVLSKGLDVNEKAFFTDIRTPIEFNTLGVV